MPLRIEPLTQSHNHDAFDCGNETLNTYLKTHALRHVSQGFGRTFVAVEDDDPQILGYHTIAPSSVKWEDFPQSVARLAVPVLLLGRLAVDRTRQRDGIGKLLLKDSLKQAIEFAENNACFAVCLDAVDDDAKAYYVQFGFKELKDNPLHLYLPMKTVRKLDL